MQHPLAKVYRMFELVEPIATVTFSEVPNEAFLVLGMRSYWDGYFAGRAAGPGAGRGGAHGRRDRVPVALPAPQRGGPAQVTGAQLIRCALRVGQKLDRGYRK
ncbi:hypothetical protein [Micromonospora fulviviridis]|uniref:Uncharacterized protein n=1 Tax=Micromonospora fulviviridis TaxID=47860 RepID=A0ABV2VQV2_9ACTN